MLDSSDIYEFEVFASRQCPLYSETTTIRLSRLGFRVAPQLTSCVVLSRDLTDLIISLISNPEEFQKQSQAFACSGCSGLLKFRRVTASYLERLPELLHLKDLPKFRELPSDVFISLSRIFTAQTLLAGETLIFEGAEVSKLYILLIGRAVVLQAGQEITSLISGDIAGELSFFCEMNATATVRAATDTVVLCADTSRLREELKTDSYLKTFFLSVMSTRLRTLIRESVVTSPGLNGDLSEFPPAEVLQVCNQNSKTGILAFELYGNLTAKVTFNNGQIIDAECSILRGARAVYEIMRLGTVGRFLFTPGGVDAALKPVGDFMTILMEGLQKIDEDE